MMEELPMNREKELNGRSVPKPSKRTRRWTLLFIGEHGKIIPVTEFKPILIISAVILFISATAAISLYFINRGNVKENRKLTDNLAVSVRQVEALQHEKDILMARLVFAESETGKTEGAKTEKGRDEPLKTGDHVDTTKPSAQPEGTPANVTPDASTKEPQIEPVAIEDLTVFHEPFTNVVDVQFTLKKIDTDPESVSGYAFVVLKDDKFKQNQWLVFPSTGLTSGKPSTVTRGQYFSISRFKSMKFEISNPRDVKRFKHITIFIFDSNETLLLEQDFPVSM